ncbi:hypothetical protein MH215_19660 [Paenibacillus sp. ACRSA]|uniref:hypothetical protein n=1 Tax=Paenibacillus sp. ACRSA TaxID=2918211 RepID=UPI001EF6B9FC|nr:hypothetical protein [Paenibacillus sp. ACRSA]MCG7379219.1 hypothetical protein [Paenibacillus sp. ACRSA]
MIVASFIMMILSVINCGIIVISKRKKIAFFKESFKQVGDNAKDQKIKYILFLNTADLIKIEGYSTHFPEDWAIIYNGPEWFYKIKLRKWNVMAVQVAEIFKEPIGIMDNSFILIRNHSTRQDSYSIIYELEEFLEFHLSNKQARMVYAET